MIDSFFYDTLKKFFKRQGITQQQIGDALGTTQVYVNSILNGRAPIGKSTAVKLNDLYGLSVTRPLGVYAALPCRPPSVQPSNTISASCRCGRSSLP